MRISNQSRKRTIHTVVISAAIITIVVPVVRGAQSTGAPATNNTPTNLKVLPKDMTTRQVRDMMEDWTDDLGAECSTCHVRDAAAPTVNGKAHYNYADDSKQEKRTARVMYTMTEEINGRFISSVPNSGVPVTCGNCHQGHLTPEPYDGSDSKSAANAQSSPKQ